MDVFVPDIVKQGIVWTNNNGCVVHPVGIFYHDLFVENQEVSHEILVGSKEERKDKLISYLTSKGVTGSSLKIYFSNYLHDWFLMVDEKRGISLGRSFNGWDKGIVRIEGGWDEEIKVGVKK